MLTIRLSRTGKKKAPQYRIVLMEKHRDPWAPAKEILGNYNPRAEKDGLVLKTERIEYWLSQGAQPSNTVHNLLVSAGIIKADKQKAVRISKKRSAKLEEKKAEEAEKQKEAQEAAKAAAEAEKAAAEEAAAAEKQAEAPAEEAPVEEPKEEATAEAATEEKAEETPAEEAPTKDAPAEESAE